ncbi:MAG: hypothetical protein WED07_15195 [Candidatus Freyarchaeum deiterrae]
MKILLHELDVEDFDHLDDELDSCLEECRERVRDPSVSRELIVENIKILQEISIAIEGYQAGVISSERLQEIKTNLLKNKNAIYVEYLK